MRSPALPLDAGPPEPPARRRSTDPGHLPGQRDPGSTGPAVDLSVLVDRAVVLTCATGFLGLALRRRLRDAGVLTFCPSRSEGLDELVARTKPEVVVHCGVGTLDEVSGELAPRTHVLPEVLAAVDPGTPPRVLVADSFIRPTRDVTRRRPPNVTVLRLGAVYGPGQHDRRALVPHVIDRFLAGGAPELDSGTGLYDWVYIDDVVDAFLRAAAHPRPGAVLDVGRGRISSVADIVTTLATKLGRPLPVRFGARPDASAPGRAVVANQTASRRLSWRPSIHPPQGLDLTVAWRREHREDLDAPSPQVEIASTG